MAGQAGSRGFWRGFFTGLLLAAIAGTVLAWLRPPVPATPPDVDPAAIEAPAAPDGPGAGVGEPASPPAPGGLLPAPAPAPLVDVKRAPEPSPGAGPGSPSLANPAAPSQ